MMRTRQRRTALVGILLTVQIRLDAASVAALRRKVNGSGGFQTLIRALQRRRQGRVLTLTPMHVEKIARYVDRYGAGGFQHRLDTVLSELRQLARFLSPLGRR